jgi:hypothetical protein
MKRLTPVLVLLSFIPIIVTVIAVFALLPDIVPTHAGFQGIDSYGSKYETFVVGGMISGFCFLLTVFFHNAEKLFALGLVHGTNARGTRIFLLVTIILFDVLSVLVVFFWMSGTAT